MIAPVLLGDLGGAATVPAAGVVGRKGVGWRFG
jgi:hypothetical protein